MKTLWRRKSNMVYFLQLLIASCADLFEEILENVNPDLSDSEFLEREEPLDAPTPAISDMGEPQTPRDELGDGEDEGDGEEEEEDEGGDGDIDEELAAELDLALGDEEDEEGDGDDEDDDEDEESEEDEDEDEDDEAVQARKLINEEIRDLEAAVAKKGKEIASSANPLIRVRNTLAQYFLSFTDRISRNALKTP